MCWTKNALFKKYFLNSEISQLEFTKFSYRKASWLLSNLHGFLKTIKFQRDTCVSRFLKQCIVFPIKKQNKFCFVSTFVSVFVLESQPSHFVETIHIPSKHYKIIYALGNSTNNMLWFITLKYNFYFWIKKLIKWKCLFKIKSSLIEEFSLNCIKTLFFQQN